MTYKSVAATFACLCLLVACNKNEMPVQDEETVVLSLSVASADVIIKDEPYTRAEGDETTFAILVRQYNTNLNSYENYARGVFDSSNNITVQLTKNKKYSFEVALFKDFFSSGQVLDAYYNTDTTYTKANNKFVYDNKIFRQMHGGFSDAFTYTNGQHSTIFRGETFYGKLNDYTATGTGTLEINLSRVSAYLEVVINGLTEGKVSATDYGVRFDIVYPNNTFSSWITDSRFMNGTSFKEGLLLRYYDSGNNETTLVQQTFTFNRNYKKTITINLNSSTQNNLSNGVSLNVSNATLQTDTPETIDCTI